MKIICRICRIFTPLLSAIIGILLIAIINPFDYITAVPNSFKYEFGITLYFGIFDYVLRLIGDIVSNLFFADVKCICFIDKSNIDISNSPLISLEGENGVGEIKCKILVSGTAKLLQDNIIKISFPDWIDAQVASSDTGMASITSDRECLIKLEKMIPKASRRRTTADAIIKIAMIHMPSEQELTINIEPEIIYSKFKLSNVMCNYNSNSFKIRSNKE